MKDMQENMSGVNEIAAYIQTETKVDAIICDAKKWARTCGYRPGQFVVALTTIMVPHMVTCAKMDDHYIESIVELFRMALTRTSEMAEKQGIYK